MKHRARIGVGAFLIALVAGFYSAKKTELFDSTIPVVVRENGVNKTLAVLQYNLIKVPPGRCAQTARLEAHDLFGKEYVPGNAWDRIHLDRIVRKLGAADSLEQLASDGVLQPGMLIGFYNSQTSLADQKDMYGNPAEFTHIGTFLGVAPDGKALVYEQNGIARRARTSREMRNDGLEPRYLFDAKN